MMRKASPVDLVIGANIQFHRLRRRLSRQALGQAVGTSAQQIEKYEIGKNRVSASRLYDIAQVLGLTFDMFFQAPALNARRARSST